MRKILLPTLLAILTVSCVASAEEGGDGPTFKKVIPTDAIRFVVNHSDDGQASTFIFDNFLISTDIGRPSSPDVNMKTFTYVRQIESSKDSCVEQHFRGFISRDGTASATMIVHSGGKTTAVDLKKAIAEAQKDTVIRDYQTREKAEQTAQEQGFEDGEPEGESDDFYVCISTSVPKGQSLQTTIILLVDRLEGDDESGALLTIDSIDNVVKAKPTKKHKK